jgi:hypothetical protein
MSELKTMKSVLSFIAILLVGAGNPSPAADTEEGFTTIFDGKTFTGWNTSTDNTNTWKNTTNPPSLLKAAANASARAHSPYKPMTPKASSTTKTSASNAWTSGTVNNYSHARRLINAG